MDQKAVQQAKKALDKAKKQDATAAAKEEASAEIAKDFSWKAGTEKGKAEAYKEAYYKQRGRAAADNKMSKNLIQERAKEGQTKDKVKKVHKEVVKLGKSLKHKQELAKAQNPEQLEKLRLKDHEKKLAQIRAATAKAFKTDKVVGVKSAKVNKLKTEERLVKIKNGRIVTEMQKDDNALTKAKALDHSKVATKAQKLNAMKGEVRGLMFLKALDTKTRGALNQVDQLKRDLAKSLAVKKKQDAQRAAKAKANPKTSAVELLQDTEFPDSMESMGAEDEPQLLNMKKEKHVKLMAQSCDCNGASNMRGHGAKCRDWEMDGTSPWCYVGWGCSHGTPSEHVQGLKWMTCKAKRNKKLKLRKLVAMQKDAKTTPELGESEGARRCACSGTENMKRQGKKCAKWGSPRKWCYVSIDCDKGTTSTEVAGAKVITNCDRPYAELGETSSDNQSDDKASSLYEQEKDQIGEGLEARAKLDSTRMGWSWGVTLASNSPYPVCVEECKQNPACVGASYAVEDVPSSNPAAPPMAANTCHQFSGITQKSSQPGYRTFLPGRMP